MTIDDAISEITNYMYSDCYLDAPSNEACKLAITALEEKKQRETGRHRGYCVLIDKNCYSKTLCENCKEIDGETREWLINERKKEEENG